MFTFPRALVAIDAIQKEILKKRDLLPGDYLVFAAQVENLFIDSALAALDEYGVPLETARKLAHILDPGGDLDKCISRLRTLDVSSQGLDPFEAKLLKDAIQFV